MSICVPEALRSSRGSTEKGVSCRNLTWSMEGPWRGCRHTGCLTGVCGQFCHSLHPVTPMGSRQGWTARSSPHGPSLPNDDPVRSIAPSLGLLVPWTSLSWRSEWCTPTLDPDWLAFSSFWGGVPLGAGLSQSDPTQKRNSACF